MAEHEDGVVSPASMPTNDTTQHGLQEDAANTASGMDENARSESVPVVESAVIENIAATPNTPTILPKASAASRGAKVSAAPMNSVITDAGRHTIATESPPTSPAISVVASPQPVYTVDASNDPVLLKQRIEKYKEVHGRLKTAYNAANEEIAQLKRKVQSLQTIGSPLQSVLLSQTHADGSPAFDIIARVSIPDPHTRAITSWLCLTGASEVMEWHQESAVRALYPQLEDTISSLKPCISPEEADNLRTKAAESQNELRHFRIRAEAMLRQKDADIQAERERALAAESIRILSPVSVTAGTHNAASMSVAVDAGEARIKSLTEQVEKLRSWQAEARERETELKDEIHHLLGQIKHLQGDEKAAATIVSPTLTSQLQHQIEGLKEERDKLMSEFTSYRKRTAGLVKEKDENISKLSEDLSSLRKQLFYNTNSTPQRTAALPDTATTVPPTPTSSSTTTLAPAFPAVAFASAVSSHTHAHALPSQQQWEYLRNIVMRYVAAKDDRVRLQLEPAILTVLDCSPVEVAGIRKGGKTAEGLVGSLLSNASSWFGAS